MHDLFEMFLENNQNTINKYTLGNSLRECPMLTCCRIGRLARDIEREPPRQCLRTHFIAAWFSAESRVSHT